MALIMRKDDPKWLCPWVLLGGRQSSTRELEGFSATCDLD